MQRRSKGKSWSVWHRRWRWSSKTTTIRWWRSLLKQEGASTLSSKRSWWRAPSQFRSKESPFVAFLLFPAPEQRSAADERLMRSLFHVVYLFSETGINKNGRSVLRFYLFLVGVYSFFCLAPGKLYKSVWFILCFGR